MARDEENGEGQGAAPNSNGNGYQQNKQRRPLGAMIENFSPAWFAVCMNTGILGILMHQFPYQFNGLPVLATIAYVLDLVLFVIFSIIFISRFIIYPHSAWPKIAEDPNELTYMVCWPIAWLTLDALTALVASQASWGGHAFTLVAYVMWWIGAAWTFIFGAIIYITVFEKNKLDYSNMPPSMFIPAVGVATVASVAGLVVNYSHDMSARLAIPIVIFAYILLGQGIFLGLILFAMYLHHLMVQGMPKGPKAPAILLLLGPTGQTATALQLLGTAANTNRVFAGVHKGTFLEASSAAGFDAASVALSLLLFGFGLFWAVVSIFCILQAVWKREMKWSFAWWSTIFPSATMNTACLLYANEMDSPAWRAVTAGFLIILLIDYFINWGYTIYLSIYGELLIPKSARKVSD